ncbi:MAG: P-loop NTPase fold protein [Parcubacteria group bacterium]|jgi:hypothetical protein
MENKNEPNYIKDCEINLEENDLLGTRCYVDAISQIIENSDTPFTIGLSGGWGSGKSSIIRTLDEKLRKDQDNKAEVFIYDAWKYSNDSFRRTFILELKKRFKLDFTDELEIFYNDKNEEVDHRLAIKKGWGFKFFLLSPLLLLLIWLINAFGSDVKISVSILSVVLVPIMFLIRESLIEYKISITKEKIFAPEQFENIFSEIIDKILNKERGVWVYIKNILGLSKKLDKIVIVIDNIDRCHEDLAFELLLTIKNFLEKQGVIFIIPVDENEIKRYLEKRGHDANEFLRKLFNTTLNIKKFSEQDLHSFAQSLNDKYNLNLPDNVISLVAQEFSKNPRRIIQFLNVLQTEILFSKKQEESGNIPVGIISGNLPFLTKVLLIREEWFDLYKRLRDNPYLLEDINQALKRGEKVDFITIEKDQLRFLDRTRSIETKNLEAFFTNKDVFLNIPDELNKLVVSQDWEEIKTILSKDVINFDQVMKFIDKRFNEDVVTRGLMDTTGFNIFSLIFKISNDKDFSDKFKETYYSSSKYFGNIKSKLNCVDIGKIANKFNPKNLIGFIRTDLSQNQTLLDTIINGFQNAVMANKDNYELFKEFILEFVDMPAYLNRVSDKFSETIKTNPNYFNDFESILKNNDVATILIKPKLLREFIDSLEVDPDSSYTETKVNIIESFKKSTVFSASIAEELINKITTLLNSINDYGVAEFWLRNLNGLLVKTKKVDVHDNVFNALNNKYSLFVDNYPAQYNNEEYKKSLNNFLNISKELYLGNKATNCHTIPDWLTTFFNKNDDNKLFLIINKIYLELIKHFSTWNWPFSQQEIDKFNTLSEWEDRKTIAETLNLMVKKTEKDKGIDRDKIKSIFLNYLNVFKTQGDKENEVLLWIKSMSQNGLAKEPIVEIIKNFDFKEKLNIIKIIKDVDGDLLKESVNEIISNFECSDLQEALNKFNANKINQTLIKGAIKTILENLTKENNESRFKCFLEFVVANGLIDKNITNIIINKVRPLLGATNEEIIFSLKIIDKLEDIDDKKKQMIKTILEGLEENDFDEQGKELLISAKSKLNEINN